jgi:DNA recombination protein RmuC
MLATLRTVASIWKQERQNRNVREIARQAGKLHEKFVSLLADMDKIGRALGSAQSVYEEARSKLHTGKGNLVSKVENLKQLGAKSDKALPSGWREADDDEEPSGDAPALPLE